MYCGRESFFLSVLPPFTCQRDRLDRDSNTKFDERLMREAKHFAQQMEHNQKMRAVET
jgi:hypothetical protein